jgi:hypothetical protein
MVRRTGARLVVTAAVLGALASAAGCGGDPGAGAPTPAAVSPSGSTVSDAEPAGGVAPTTAVLTDPPSTAPLASSPGDPGAADRCRAAAMAVTVVDDGNAAGHRYRRVVFTNTGAQPCTLTGYPGISFRDAADKPVGGPATREPVDAGTVTVAPGAEASSVLDERSADALPADACGDLVPVVALRVYLPDDTRPATVPTDGQACPSDVGQLSVRPVQAGRDSQS